MIALVLAAVCSAAALAAAYLSGGPESGRAWVGTAGVALGGCAAITVGAGEPRMAGAIVAVPVLVFVARLALDDFASFALLVVAVRPWLDLSKGSADGSGALATMVAVGFLAAAALWIPLQRGARSWHEQRWVIAGTTALFVAGVASVPFAPFTRPAATEALRLASALVMFVVLSLSVRDREATRRILLALFATSLLPIVVGAGQAATGIGELNSDGVSRVRGTMTHPNSFGLYLAMLLVVAVALVPRVTGRVRWALAGLTVLYAVLLALTYSRSAWIAALAGLVVVGWLQMRALLALVVVVPLAALLIVPSLRDRVADLGEERQVSGAAGNSLAWRFDYWGETLPLAADNPFTGVGLKNTPRLTADAKVIHNDFLRSYVEMGILGAIAFLAFLGSLIGAVRHALRRPGDRRAPSWPRGAAVGAAGALGAFIVFCLGGNAMSSVVILWPLAAIVMAGSAGTRAAPTAEVPPVSSARSSATPSRTR